MSIYVYKNKICINKVLFKDINTNIIPYHINLSATNKLIDRNPNTDRYIYSSQDPYYNGVGKFIRNTSCWLNGVSNISCASPAQLSGAAWNTRAGTLITKKHVLFAKHYVPSIISGGTPLIFVADDNTVIRRNLVQLAFDTNLNGNGTDIAVGLLDNEVPSNIKIAKVLPINFEQYFNTSIIASSYDNFNTGLHSFRHNPWIYAVGVIKKKRLLLNYGQVVTYTEAETHQIQYGFN